MSVGSKKRFRYSFVLFCRVCLALFCALILWEIILGNYVRRMPPRVENSLLGVTFRPGTYVFGTEGYCRAQLNSLGMRGPDPLAVKPDQYRVLAVGDSFTEGFQVSDSALYTAQLQRILQRRPHKSAVVFNAGVSGRSPADYIALSSVYRKIYSPDAVVVQINEGDFMSDLLHPNSGNIHSIVRAGSGFRTEATGTEQSGYVSKRLPPSLRWTTNLALTKNLEIRLGQLKSQSAAAAKGSKNAAKPEAFPQDMMDWVVVQLKHTYPNVVLLYIPNIQFFSSDRAQTPLESQLERTCRKHGVDFINVRADFLKHYERTKQLPTGFNNTSPGQGHTNGAGHRIMAQKLALVLERKAKQ